MKILHVISDTNLGGAGRVLLNYLAFRDKNAFDVEVALPRGSALLSREELRGVRVYELDGLRDKSLDLPAIQSLSRVIRDAAPDLVHTHGAFSGRVAAKRRGVPVVFTRHSAFPPAPRLTRGLGKMAFRALTARYADRIIAVSEVCRDGLIQCGVPPGKIDVILNGSPPVPRLTDAERTAVRASRGVAADELLVGILARIEPYKGHMYLLEAMEILLAQGRKIKLLIAGTGEYEPEVKARARALGVSDAVQFLGFVGELAPFLGILDVQVNASTVEATSLSLLEGMSVGLPAVASDDGGNTRVIRDGENGLVFKSRDSAGLADCLARLTDDAALRDRLGAGALEVYAREFTGDRTARETENTYRKVWEERNGK